MRKLKFHYEMQLDFSGDVYRHSFALRCLPKETCTQRIVKLSCSITPLTSITKSWDAFGNPMCFGYIAEPHDYFSFCVAGTAITNSENIDNGELNHLFYYPTPQTTLTHGMEYYLELAQQQRDPVQKTLCMSDALYHNFIYKPNTTTTQTTAQQALDQGTGVCQDYTHIMLALCRRCQIPARYVAGFMIGEGATHAWLEVYARGHWIGVDPTNNRVVDDMYIKMSEGRDASDCIVDKGVFFGDVKQKQRVFVKVTQEPLE